MQDTKNNPEKSTTVKLTTNQGAMTLSLDAEKAPETVENFLRYVREGFYDGTIFHRVIPGFMIQGGGFEPGMKEKAAHGPIRNEADNGLANGIGTIAMARTSDPHSASAQFFINTNANAFLDHKAATEAGWGYCVFGEVVDGKAVFEAIGKMSTGSKAGHDDVPLEDVVLTRAEILGQ